MKVNDVIEVPSSNGTFLARVTSVHNNGVQYVRLGDDRNFPSGGYIGLDKVNRVSWTIEDSAAASSEGWNLIEAGAGLSVGRHFDYDADALARVKANAKRSHRAAKALALIEADQYRRFGEPLRYAITETLARDILACERACQELEFGGGDPIDGSDWRKLLDAIKDKWPHLGDEYADVYSKF